MFNYSGIISYNKFNLQISDTFKSLHPDLELPSFRWLQVGGSSFVDDIAMAYHNNLYNQLIVSEVLWETLSDFQLGNFKIAEAILQDNL